MTIKWSFLILVWLPTLMTNAKNLHDLIDNLKPYGVVIFTNDSKQHDFDRKITLGNLMSNQPVIAIDLNGVNHTNDDRSYEMLGFKNPRGSGIYVIIPSEMSDVSEMLENIVKISPLSSRPKSLLLQSANFSESNLKKILKKAWTLKFLDFSVIVTYADAGNSTFMTYNPFTDEYDKRSLKDVNDLFPDKLTNANGYPLRTRAFHLPPLLVTEIKNNTIVNVGGSSFARIKYTAEKLNFKLQYMTDPKNSDGASYLEAVNNVESGDINVSPICILLYPKFQNRSILVGDPMNLNKLLVMVPVIQTPKLDLTLDTIIILFLFWLILTIFYAFVRVLKLNSDHWNVFYIYGTLIGIPILQPQRRVDKIVYVTIAILSIIFSNNYFSALANIKLHFVDQELNTYEDINRMKIPVYIPSVYVDNDTEVSKKLSLTRIDSLDKCVEMMIESNKVACIGDPQSANYHFFTKRNSANQPIMKITDLSFQYVQDVYLHEKGSPFAEKIEKSIRQIFESHITSVLESRAGNKVKIVATKQSRLVEETLLTQILLIIICIGNGLALITFGCEYSWYFRNVSFQKFDEHS